MSALLILAFVIFEWDPTGNPVRPIFGDRDRRLADLVDLVAALDAAYCIADIPSLNASMRWVGRPPEDARR